MRKAILLITALIVTFGAFAKGPMTASAPSLAAVFGHFGDDIFAEKDSDLDSRLKAARVANPAAFVKPSIPATQFISNEISLDLEHLDLGSEIAGTQSAEADHIPATVGFDANGWMTLSVGDVTTLTEIQTPKSYANAGAVVRNASVRNAGGPSLLTRTQKHLAGQRRTTNMNGNAVNFAPPTVDINSVVNTRTSEKMLTGRVAKQRARNSASLDNSVHRIEFAAETELSFGDHSQVSFVANEVSNADRVTPLIIRSESGHVSLSVGASDLTIADRSVLEVKQPEFTAPKVSFSSETEHFVIGSGERETSISNVIDRDVFYVADAGHFNMASTDVSDQHVIDREVQLFAQRHSLGLGNSLLAGEEGFIATDRTPFVTPAYSIENSHSVSLFKSDSEILADVTVVERAAEPVADKLISADWLSSYTLNGPENKASTAKIVVSVPSKLTVKSPAMVTGLSTLNTAALSDSPRILPGLPAKKAAAVVTGMSTLNVAPMRKSDGNYCDSNFIGEPIRFSQTAELTLEDLLLQIHNRFGVNFLMGPNVGTMPINIKAGAIPWNVLLKSQLFISGIRARCIDSSTIELVQNSALPSLQDQADVETRFVKLKFLQRTTGNSVDLAGRSQGGQGGGQGGCAGSGTSSSNGGSSGGGSSGGSGGQTGDTAAQQGSSKFDKLIIEIEKIVGLRSMRESSVGSQDGNMGGSGSMSQQTEVIRSNRYVTQIPGRNILAIRATKEEFELIDQIIERADRPPFQVVIKGLVYTANQDKLQDIGVQTTITGGTADGRSGGGIFGHTLGVPGTLFDFSTVIGTFDFNVQATALQRNGVISVKNRPFATVLDGLCTTLEVGRQIPIVIDSTLGGQGDVVFVSASNKLAVTPYVVDDDNGNPVAVTLEIRLDSNDVDRTVQSEQPAVSVRSINTQLLLKEDMTAILGGFTVDSDERNVSKTPGLGDIPIIGELFKRRTKTSNINRLYFALTVAVLPYGEPIQPVSVPGATTDPPSITPQMKQRSDKAEPIQVTEPKKTGP